MFHPRDPIVFLALLLALSGCSKMNASEKKAKEYNEELQRAVNAPIVEVHESPYVGATPVEYSRDYRQYPIFSAQASLNMRGTLQDVCRTIGQMLKLSVQAEADESASGPPRTVNFEGKTLALLDYVGTLFGASWTYDPAGRSIAFSRMQVRTFTILAAPGALNHSTRMSSSSQQGSGYGGDYRNGGGPVGNTPNAAGGTTSDSGDAASADTSQTLSGEYSVDVWKECENSVKALLSPQGSVTLNRAAGSVMVRDVVPVIRQVAAYIETLNNRLLRQVALSVKVWSVDLSDDSDVGLNVSLFFKNDNFKLASGASVLSGLNMGSLTATIVDGDLKDSNATLKALNTIGKATQVTSGSGVCMNNQPLPVQNVKRQSYLAGVSTFTPTTGGNTTALIPSQVTYGFAMTVIPNILDRRRAVLQYNVSLSDLDKLEELKSGDNSIQLPTVSIRSFNQRVFMSMGQTLVLAGFEQEREHSDTTAAIFSLGNKRKYGKSLIVITITMQSMQPALDSTALLRHFTPEMLAYGGQSPAAGKTLQRS